MCSIVSVRHFENSQEWLLCDPRWLTQKSGRLAPFSFRRGSASWSRSRFRRGPRGMPLSGGRGRVLGLLWFLFFSCAVVAIASFAHGGLLVLHGQHSASHEKIVSRKPIYGQLPGRLPWRSESRVGTLGQRRRVKWPTIPGKRISSISKRK